MKLILASRGLAAIAALSTITMAGGSHLYWSDTAPPIGQCRIRGAHLDATHGVVLQSGLRALRGIALDNDHGRIYWAEPGSLLVRSARLDGGDMRDLAATTDTAGGVAVDPGAGKVYWTESAYTGQPGKIRRCNLDGTSAEDVPAAGLQAPVAVALDLSAGKLYWSDLLSNTIECINLDGTAQQLVVPDTHGDANGIALDPLSGRIYWCAIPQPQVEFGGSVWRANPDGTSEQMLFSNLTSPAVPALDVAGGKVYWTESWDGHNPRIARGNLDGTGSVEDIVTGLGIPWGLAIGPGPALTLHEYPFENGSDGQAATCAGSILDSGAPAANGDPTGGPTYSCDVPQAYVGCANDELSLSFDGIDDVVTFHSPFIFHAQFADATLEFWMKAPDQSHRALIWSRGDVNDVDRFHISVSPGGVLGFDYREANGSLRTLLPGDGTFTYPVDTWAHIAVTRTTDSSGSQTYRFFRDGMLVHTAVDTSPALPTSTIWTIAGRPPPHERFIGLLDEIRMTDRALQPSEFLDAPRLPCMYCTPKVNSQGCTPSVGFSGLPSLSGPDDFIITATNVLNNKPGMLLWSATPANSPHWGGTLCLGGSIVRTPIQWAGGNSGPDDCSGSYSFHFSQAYMALHFMSAGTETFAQYWSRDPAFTNPNNVGLTDALHFTIGQ